MTLKTVTRFAPSPTGGLHPGHAFSALFAYDAAKASGGRFLLRLEDIDETRCRPEFASQILADLAWLGLTWEEPVRRQSDHMDNYRAALHQLEAQGLIYPCFCTRKDIALEIAASREAPHGPDGPLYPGICRDLSPVERAERMARGDAYSLRLDSARAIQAADGPLFWHDREAGRIEATPEILGDVVLGRKDIPTSYHLAVTVDDHSQGVTLVTRGTDLFHATHIHRLLQALLGFRTPDYHHHPLLTDAQGRRYAKRDNALTLASLRKSGATPAGIRQMISAAKPQF
jgi:glutamyl-Q tRNA(Asp) synthetase